MMVSQRDYIGLIYGTRNWYIIQLNKDNNTTAVCGTCECMQETSIDVPHKTFHHQTHSGSKVMETNEKGTIHVRGGILVVDTTV